MLPIFPCDNPAVIIYPRQDNCVLVHRSTEFKALSIVRNSMKLEIRTFRHLDVFLSSCQGKEASVLLCRQLIEDSCF
jgi:hypothetical protein